MVQVRLQDTLFIAVDKEDVLVGKTILDSEKNSRKVYQGNSLTRSDNL